MRDVQLFQIGDFLIAERELDGFCGSFYLRRLGSADNGRRHLGKQPGKGDFRHGYAALFRKPCDAVDDASILFCGSVIF